jgi:predicted 2-oxoglutarate/Fe(II)-dependent dioxygenase YbiX
MKASSLTSTERGPGWAVMNGALPRASCMRAIEAMMAAAPRSGGVLRKGEELNDLRLRYCFEHLPDQDIAAVVSETLWTSALAVIDRDEASRCGLDGPKFCSYPAGGYFRAHRDHSDDPNDPAYVRHRTLSFSCVLNDDQAAGGLPTFDGGTLVLYVREPNGSVASVNLRPSAGSVVAFRADLMHEVRPVRTGTRFAAVAWLYTFDENSRNGEDA